MKIPLLQLQTRKLVDDDSRKELIYLVATTGEHKNIFLIVCLLLPLIFIYSWIHTALILWLCPSTMNLLPPSSPQKYQQSSLALNLLPSSPLPFPCIPSFFYFVQKIKTEMRFPTPLPGHLFICIRKWSEEFICGDGVVARPFVDSTLEGRPMSSVEFHVQHSYAETSSKQRLWKAKISGTQ